MYTDDNDGQLLESALVFSGPGRTPLLMRSTESHMLNPVSNEPYTEFFDLDAKTLAPGNPFICPFMEGSYFRETLGNWRWQNYSYFDISYSYFAQVEKW